MPDNIEVPIMDSTTIDELIINSHEDGTQPESLWDPAVRLAIAYAIDKQQIINVAYLGYADALGPVVPASMGDWHNSDIVDIPFDIAEGNRVLDDAGYVDSDGDGIREYSDGTPLEYRLYGSDDCHRSPHPGNHLGWAVAGRHFRAAHPDGRGQPDRPVPRFRL